MILNRIVQKKEEEVAALYKETGLDNLKEQIKKMPQVSNYRFKEALEKKGLSVIAEVKKASPSKGVIRESFDAIEIAREFEELGASALSVLTDESFFQGKLSYLEEIKNVVTLPVLRKDFMIDPIQLYEAKLAGADAILLIVRILTIEQLVELCELAKILNLDVLIETHNQKEIETVFTLDTDLNHCILGINNRNLDTFETDINVSVLLKNYSIERFSHSLPIVAESGYSQKSELISLSNQGFSGVLIGEALAKNTDLLSL